MSQARLLAFGWIVSAIAWAAAPAIAAAQEAAFHHVHLNTTDPAAAAKWYADHWGGEAKKIGIFMPPVSARWCSSISRPSRASPAPAASSITLASPFPTWRKSSSNWPTPRSRSCQGLNRKGRFASPTPRIPGAHGSRFSKIPRSEGFHHVHLASVDPEATLAWYKSAFGGELGRFAGEVPGIRYGDVLGRWSRRCQKLPAPTKGRSIDHIGAGLSGSRRGIQTPQSPGRNVHDGADCVRHRQDRLRHRPNRRADRVGRPGEEEISSARGHSQGMQLSRNITEATFQTRSHRGPFLGRDAIHDRVANEPVRADHLLAQHALVRGA